ncbi:hypothetical protein K435DRAFT_847595 [Dendrothele bispora CBS 962.96]|uniref:Uncharacterized protein n=1 Tax=Dendrothele bispora (strain CBS 962.96) TaxID=1314807 RepID=A0A4S8MWR3_DENBC|nr:hypothetical protein K435DRAFT_847595 [Dendrothele bispora CBS 962.96]
MPRTPKASSGRALLVAYKETRPSRRRIERQADELQSAAFQDLQEERDLWKGRAQDAERSLKAKNDQLAAVQFFLSSTDPHSGEDVQTTLQRLNTEIHQISAIIADILGRDPKIQEIPVLVDPRHPAINDMFMLTQHRLQTALTTWCKSSILSWGLHDSVGESLSRARYDIEKRGGYSQALIPVNNGVIARAWRTLTRSTIESSGISAEDITLLANSLSMILCGCCGYAPEVVGKLELEKKADAIGQLASQLDKMIIRIHSTEYELLVPKPGDKFSHSTMEDVGDSLGEESAVYEVGEVCSIGLKAVAESGYEIVLLRAQVLLLPK